MDRKEHIVKLIAQDIKHNQLTNGLEKIGLTDNETYTLDIVSVILSMMNLPPTDKILNFYHSEMLKIKYNLTQKERNSKAHTIFETLGKEN